MPLLLLAACASSPSRDVGTLDATTGGYRKGDAIAVLLPQSGRFAELAQAVRDGIDAASQADAPAVRPTIRFYDSAKGDPMALLQRAAADGARLAIGPLEKPAVDRLARAQRLPLPTLALNYAKDAATVANLYQFSLALEDEAAEVASRAFEQGYRTARLLVPEGPWGQRVEAGFRQRWEGLGGTVGARVAYAPGGLEYDAAVAAAVGGGVASAEMVFLAAAAADARVIWPAIKQAAGPDAPVLTTSHVLRGPFDPAADAALVGLRLVDIPWLLAPSAPGEAVTLASVQAKRPGGKGDYLRLFAMGVDAYRLASRLEELARPGTRFRGKTGILSIDAERRVKRGLGLARLEAGGPVLAATPAPASAAR